jgi:hypothetical protein
MKTVSKIYAIVSLFTVIYIPSIAVGQNFEGVINYQFDISLSKKFIEMGITKEAITSQLKKNNSWYDSVKMYFKGGNYFSLSNNGSYKIYKADANKIFNFNSGENTCAVQDGVDLDLEGKPDKPRVIELDTLVMIMGFPCKVIRMKWPLSQVDYYYNASQAKVEPNYFAKHSQEGLSLFIEKSKSLPLRIARLVMGIQIIQTATEIKSVSVKEDVFKIPELIDDESLNLFKLPGMKIMRIKK